MLRESELHGALSNPNEPAAKNRAADAPPIKAELIGTEQDTQLQSALAFLARSRLGMK